MATLNIARCFTSTVGTGNIQLGNAVPGFLSWDDAGAVNGTTYSYGLQVYNANGTVNASEAGTIVFNTGGLLTSRTVTNSTNSGNPISLPAGATIHIYTTILAADIPVSAGTVTNVSAGNLSPLFTTNVTNPTTTPDIQFSLTNAAANTYLGNATGAPAAPSYTAAGALTKVDDTNVTLTLGGAPTTALLTAASLTLGWTGQLSLARGGTAANLTASNGGLVYSTAGALAILSGTATANQIPLSGANAAPSWSTATYPGTAAQGTVLNASGSNVIGATVSPTLGVQQTTRGSLILANTAAGAFPVTVQSSNSTTAAWTLTLPVDAGTNTYVLTTNGSGVTSWAAPGGGGGTPGGSDTQIQYNNAGAFGGITGATSDGTNVTLTSPRITTDVRPSSNDGASLGISGTAFADLFLASGGVINWNAGNYTITHSAGVLTFAGAQTITSTSATAFVVGANGTTNPVLTVNANTASVATGVSVTGAAAAGRAAIAVTSSGTDEGLSVDAKGAGTIRLGATSTGAVEFSRNAVPTASDGSALGTTALQWADLFLASGGVINWANGGASITGVSTLLTYSAGAGGAHEFTGTGGLRPSSNDGGPLGSTALMWSDLFLASGGVINFNNGNTTLTQSANTLKQDVNTNGNGTFEVANASTGASSIGRFVASTGTANAFTTFETNDNSGSPFSRINVGSAVSDLRLSTNGTVRASVSSSGLRLGTAGTTLGALLFSGNTSGTVTMQSAAAAGTWTMTLPTTGGTSGYFLQTNGSGVTTWAAGGGSGGITQIGSTLNPTSGSSVAWTSIPATYAQLAIYVTGVSFTGTSTLNIRLSTNNGSSYDSTVANYPKFYCDTGSVVTYSESSASVAAQPSQTAAATGVYSVILSGYQSGPYTQYEFWVELSTGSILLGSGYFKSTSAIDAIQISTPGTFDGSGTAALYGIS